jgi:CSLREA domain-containing protein
MSTSRFYSKPVFYLAMFLILMAAIASSVQAATLTITKTADTNDGICNADCSLREAIAASNATASNDVIEFDATVFSVARVIIAGGF